MFGKQLTLNMRIQEGPLQPEGNLAVEEGGKRKCLRKTYEQKQVEESCKVIDFEDRGRDLWKMRGL